MLAYITLSDWVYIPSFLEVTVYLLGLIVLMASPYVIASLITRRPKAPAADQIPSPESPQS